MQTILGAGGAAGTEIAKQLINYTKEIRIVSRNPKKVNNSDQLMRADLLNPSLLDEAVKGSEVVYVTIAFEYKTAVWKEKWPMFMNNLIQSCKLHNSKIVFVDNIYMYDINYLSNMTEETPINPVSEKGKVRAEIFNMLMSAGVNALVARSADFYGPSVTGSYFTQMILNNLKKDKAPQWFGNLDIVHNFTYNKDVGKAVALLGNTQGSYNQVWHLPTYEGKLTSRQWINLIMKNMNTEKKIKVYPVWTMSLLGLFVPIIRELKGISYQLDRDYYFNSSKFNKHFNFTPTSPEEGIKETVNN